MPALFLLHERKFQQCHQQLFKEAIKHVPALKTVKHPIVTDEEKGIVNAVEDCLPNIVRVRCWNHIIRDVTRWLRAHGAPFQMFKNTYLTYKDYFISHFIQNMI